MSKGETEWSYTITGEDQGCVLPESGHIAQRRPAGPARRPPVSMKNWAAAWRTATEQPDREDHEAETDDRDRRELTRRGERDAAEEAGSEDGTAAANDGTAAANDGPDGGNRGETPVTHR